jgi:hypothetical protein
MLALAILLVEALAQREPNAYSLEKAFNINVRKFCAVNEHQSRDSAEHNTDQNERNCNHFAKSHAMPSKKLEFDF